MADRVGEQLGNYRLTYLLSDEGGFADVYLGEHVHLGTQAAIKVLTRKLTDDEIAQFRNEARTMIGLQHPNIVQVLDFGMQGRLPFIVMQYASNGSLGRLHPRGTCLPLQTILTYVKQVASALQYAHDRRVIHRDVKPANMLVGPNNDILLSDFGIAIIAHRTDSWVQQNISGTDDYMAPEQFYAKAIPASDQYALGIAVYRWLCGELPFTEGQIGYHHNYTPPPPLHTHLPSILPAVEHVVLRALAKDPQQRFANVQAFAYALQQASQSSPNADPLLNESAILTKRISLPKSDDLRRMLAISLVDKLHPPQRGISRRTVVLGLAGLASVAVAGGSIALLTHTQPSQTPTVAPPNPQTPTPTVAALNPAITSSGAMFGYDLAHTHFNPDEHLLSPTNVSRLVPLWNAATGLGITSSPAVANGVVYIGSYDKKLYAFEAGTGKLLWSAATGDAIQSSPAVANGVVYIGSRDSKLYAFEVGMGKPLWSAATGDVISSSPAVANEVVYVGSEDFKLYAFEVGMGKLLWSAPTTGAIYSSPAVTNGVVYVGSLDFKLYAFNATTGKLLWSVATTGAIASSPAVTNGVVYVGSWDTKLYAFNATTGKQLWSAATGGLIRSSPAVANGVVYVGSDDKKLYAFNATTGKPLWSAVTGGSIYSLPAVANGVVYVGSLDKKLYAFNATTGKTLWSAATEGSITSSPAVASGVVYIGSYDIKLYAFHLP